MGKKIKTKKPQAQRPKGPGAKQAPRRASTRVRKQAAKPTELAAPAAQRCGQEDCKVCNPQPCNNCSLCKASRKPTAGHCHRAIELRQKPCPNMAPAPRDDGVDPRKLDKKGPYFKASTEITGVMDALADPTKLEPSDLYALGCFKHSLDVSGRLDARWASLDKIKARDDYDIDDINANQEAAIEAVVREVLFKDGSKPSAEEMAKMGPLEMLTVVRVLSYKAPITHRTKAQSSARKAAMRQSYSDEARNTFMAFVEGRSWDGDPRHICSTLARGKKSWPKYWQECLDLLGKKERVARLTGGPKRFKLLLRRLREESPAWACTPEMREWLRVRECQYQCIIVSTPGHW